MPATRTEFWLKKFQVNVTRDRRVVDELQLQGWRVAVVWECGLRSADLDPLIAPIEAWIRCSDDGHFELPGLPASTAGRSAKGISSQNPTLRLVRSS